MRQKEIVLWIDERWYDAISKNLKNGTLEEHLEDIIDQLCNQLPEREYKKISEEIWREDQQTKQDHEAARRFAVFHVTEDGDSKYFIVEEKLDMLQAATQLRSYIRRERKDSPMHFWATFYRGAQISQAQFNTYVAERLENSGRVIGAFNIDLDKGTFEALHIMDRWQCFCIKDISTAAYFANKKTNSSYDERWKIFLEHLDGKQLCADT